MKEETRAFFVPRRHIAGGRIARVPERSQVLPLPLFAVAGVKSSETERESTPNNYMTRATIPTGRAACRPQLCRSSSSAYKGPREIVSAGPSPVVRHCGCQTVVNGWRLPEQLQTLAMIPTGHRAACRPQQDRALRLSGLPSLKWVTTNTYHRTPLHVRAPGGTIHAIGCTPVLGSTLLARSGSVTKCPS